MYISFWQGIRVSNALDVSEYIEYVRCNFLTMLHPHSKSNLEEFVPLEILCICIYIYIYVYIHYVYHINMYIYTIC